jgi:hypothetical protein
MVVFFGDFVGNISDIQKNVSFFFVLLKYGMPSLFDEIRQKNR